MAGIHMSIINMLNRQLGEKIKDVIFLISTIVIFNNSVLEIISIVIGLGLVLENV